MSKNNSFERRQMEATFIERWPEDKTVYIDWLSENDHLLEARALTQGWPPDWLCGHTARRPASQIKPHVMKLLEVLAPEEDQELLRKFGDRFDELMGDDYGPGRIHRFLELISPRVTLSKTSPANKIELETEGSNYLTLEWLIEEGEREFFYRWDWFIGLASEGDKPLLTLVAWLIGREDVAIVIDNHDCWPAHWPASVTREESV